MANTQSRLLETKGNVITSPFGNRTITYTSGPAKGQTVTKNHNGIDIVGTGHTLDNIVAHTEGKVKSAGFDSACGNYVQIETASGALMVYYHMVSGSLKVKTGDRVKQGQVLGRMGATGNVTGAHLHFGIKVKGKWIDPKPYINADYEKTAEKPAASQSTIKVDPARSFERTFAKKYTVTTGLNLRTGASTDKKVIRVMKKGEMVTCYGYYTKNGSTIWLYVKDKDGNVGFCSKKYLK